MHRPLRRQALRLLATAARTTPWLILLTLVAFAAPGDVTASHHRYQGVAIIESPDGFATVRGSVSISGTAIHPQFQRYELWYSPEPVRDDSWVFIGEARFNPVQGGLLGTWNTGGIPDGAYSLRLRVVRQDGNYDEAFARGIVVANSAPIPTPTPFVPPTVPPPAAPSATPTSEATATPVVIEQPEIPTPTPRPSETPTPELLAPDVDQINDDSGFFAQTFDFEALRNAFAEGLTYAGAAFLAIGAFFGVKRVLTWLWYLIAP